ncbi:hypothetical protein LZ31DRAFT_29806 [Colletotrichum somersetense]|nr:hypothetical protein LZ31DRAFT_29806 [Colletotrichum somersetense]
MELFLASWFRCWETLAGLRLRKYRVGSVIAGDVIRHTIVREVSQAHQPHKRWCKLRTYLCLLEHSIKHLSSLCTALLSGQLVLAGSSRYAGPFLPRLIENHHSLQLEQNTKEYIQHQVFAGRHQSNY